MPSISPPAKSSRPDSTRSFSRNGSPTWTDRRLAALPSAAANGAPASADASRPGRRSEQHGRVADALGRGFLQVAVRPEAHAERVHQRVARIAGVEHELAADVGQAQAVAVERDSR